MRAFILGAAVVACSSPAVELAVPRTYPIGPSSTLITVLTADERLATPRALAFNPLRPDEMWVLNAKDNSVVILHDTGSDHQTYERRHDAAADHFLDKPSAIAFGADKTSFGSVGTFATCGESRNEHGIEGTDDFMGPVLWTSDLSIFAKKNPMGLGSHIDMLHESPLCMGIAHDHDNVYWATNGLTNSILRYDFGVDHNVGRDDHSDGSAAEYARGQLAYVAGVPSHMALRDGWLYVADTGHGRIAKLDIHTGTPGGKLMSPENLRGGAVIINGATLVDFVRPGTLAKPSGLTIENDTLYVSDHGSGMLRAYDLRTGGEVASYDTHLGPGALAGIAFGPDGRLYFADMKNNTITRVDTN